MVIQPECEGIYIFAITSLEGTGFRALIEFSPNDSLSSPVITVSTPLPLRNTRTVWKPNFYGSGYFTLYESISQAIRSLSELWGVDPNTLQYPPVRHAGYGPIEDVALSNWCCPVVTVADGMEENVVIMPVSDGRGSFRWINIPEQVTWRDSKYAYPREAARKCVYAGHASAFEVQGRSSTPRNNTIVLSVTQEVRKLPCVHVVWDNFSTRTIAKVWHYLPDVCVRIATPSLVLACYRIKSELRKVEATTLLKSFFSGTEGYDVVEIDKVNQSLVGCLLHDPPAGYVVVRVTESDGGSRSAVFVRLKQKMRLPDNHLRAIVIGRGGMGLKRLSAELGEKIILIDK